jgi:hypothetical protein
MRSCHPAVRRCQRATAIGAADSTSAVATVEAATLIQSHAGHAGQPWPATTPCAAYQTPPRGSASSTVANEEATLDR